MGRADDRHATGLARQQDTTLPRHPPRLPSEILGSADVGRSSTQVGEGTPPRGPNARQRDLALSPITRDGGDPWGGWLSSGRICALWVMLSRTVDTGAHSPLSIVVTEPRAGPWDGASVVNEHLFYPPCEGVPFYREITRTSPAVCFMRGAETQRARGYARTASGNSRNTQRSRFGAHTSVSLRPCVLSCTPPSGPNGHRPPGQRHVILLSC